MIVQMMDANAADAKQQIVLANEALRDHNRAMEILAEYAFDKASPFGFRLGEFVQITGTSR